MSNKPSKISRCTKAEKYLTNAKATSCYDKMSSDSSINNDADSDG
jgi:hypothetical protein